MNQMPVPSDYPPQLTSSVGRAVLAVLILGVAGWMYSQRQTSTVPADARTTPPPGAMPVDLPGFRPDAWFLPDEDLLGFVEIPAGPFQMGGDPTTDRQAFENERWSPASAHGTVDLPTYYIGRYEVTVAQFAAFVDAAGFSVGEQTFQGPPNHHVSAVSSQAQS